MDIKQSQGFSRKVILPFDEFTDFPTIGSENNLYYDKETGEMYYWNGTEYVPMGGEPFKVILTVQPTPTATNNANNRNSIFKDADGNTWAVDNEGNAISLGGATPAIFKELNQWHVDKNGSDTTGSGADENPYLTITKALSVALTADAVVVTEGTYAEAVTISTQNLTMRGEGSEYGGLTEINSLAVTATGTSVRVSSLTVLGNTTHTGTSPLYLSDTTLNGNYSSSTTAYSEIKHSRVQTGAISKTAAGILFITDSLIGNATFSTANSVISLRNVTIDAGKTVTIGAGVIYSLADVVGNIVINAGAIPLETVLLAQGLTPLQSKLQESSTFNDIRLTNVNTTTTATKMLVRDADGIVREQLFPSGLPSGGTDGQVLTVQPNGSYAWETLPTSTAPLHQREVLTATDGQTIFTLAKTPIGDTEKVHVTRNGIDISSSFTWVGNVGTYDSTQNYNCTIDANDKLIFHFESN